MSLLEIKNLHIAFPPWGDPSVPVKGLDLRLEEGRVLGLVGQSGSGKSLASLAVMGMVPPPGRITEGSIHFLGTDLLSLSSAGYRRLRGREMFLIFQGTGSALTPTLTIGRQMAEVFKHLEGAAWRKAMGLAENALADVGLPARVMQCYPFELSGGMRQRALVAMALAMKPRLIIADEATTGLDMSTQAEVLGLFAGLKAKSGISMIVVSHDLRVVGSLADEVAVMHEGRVVDLAPISRLPEQARHPHTAELLFGLPGLFPSGGAMLKLESLGKTYPGQGTGLKALDDVSLELAAGVGRSASWVKAVRGKAPWPGASWAWSGPPPARCCSRGRTSRP